MPRPRSLLLAVPVIALDAGGAWHRWSSTPVYALRQLAEGVERHDKDLVLRHLDGDATAARVVGSVLDAATTQAVREQQGSGRDATFAAFPAAMVHGLKPAATAAVASMVHGALTTWAIDSAATARASRGDDAVAPVAELAQEFADGGQRFVGETATWGDSPSVELRLAQVGLDTTLGVPVLLRKTGGAWKVAGVKDVGRG
jgi:hypothetical protein